jgi:site-specific recombinase XerD
MEAVATPAKRSAKELPRGYRVRMMTDGRTNPALLLIRGALHEAFPTASAARGAGLALAEKEREFGREVRDFDPREWRRYLEAKATHFGGKEPNWAALSHRMTLETSAMTVAAAIERYRKDRDADGLSPATLSQVKKKLARLGDEFGARKLHEVDSEAVKAWLGKLAAEFAPWTVRDHLKVVNTFWQHARRSKWCLDNPLDAVVAPKVPQEEINILTVAETQKLFLANAGEACIGRLALEAFGGLRFSSAGRLLAADLKWADKGIELPGAKHKSGRRHYLDGLPDNLWAWLESAPAACWDLTERQYMKLKGEAFIRAGVTSTQNCLRHSFATYHVAGRKDAAATAILMQHTSPTMLYKHYKGNATTADGGKYFAIVPPVYPPAP